MRRTPTSRPGFTLIELLVAAALSLVVMTILSLAFQTGMQTLSQLKSVVGMAEQLRAAEGVLRRDLSADHLEADQGQGRRVSQAGGHIKGYFAFTQGGTVETAPGVYQGFGPLDERLAGGGTASPDLPVSFRTPAPLSGAGAPARQRRAWMDHLSFTVRLAGDKPQEVFTAPTGPAGSTLLSRLLAADPSAVPPEYQSADPTNTQLTSRWAEVSYLLLPSGPNGGTLTTVFSSDEGGVAELPLYTLYRRQRVLADHTVASPTFAATDAQSARGIAMAQVGTNWAVLGPEGLASGGGVANRLGGTADLLAPPITSAETAPNDPFRRDHQRRGYPIPAGTGEYGSDVLLNNVVSMTVRAVFSHAIPPQVYDYIRTNNLSGPTVVSPDGLAPTGDQFLSYSPRSLLFPNVTSQAGPNNYASPSQFPRFYDTAGGGFSGMFLVNNNPVPASITGFKLKAVEIKLRVYDNKNKTSRQMTVLQDL